MSEKRYSLVYYADKGGAFIRDNKNSIEWYHDSRASLLEIVDKLNELAEENQYLKSLKWNQDCINEIGISMQQIQLLKKENDELKKHIQELSDYIEELGGWEDDRKKIL